MARLFGTDGVRGIAGTELTIDLAMKLGQAGAYVLTKEKDKYPLNLNNWEFFIVPTAFINEHCGNNKTISLSRIRNFGFRAFRFDEIKAEVDRIIDELK